MAMASQTKTKTKPRTARTTEKAQATEIKNVYTHSIGTIKEQDIEKTHSSTKSKDIQNLEAEIKMSSCKRKGNHLKSLINFYFKLILYFSQINKILWKILKTKIHTNYSYNETLYNIINIQKQQQQQHPKLKENSKTSTTISFKYHKVKNILKKLFYFRRENVKKYIKVTIVNNEMRTFPGICLKRLISFKRLQQIPETHNNFDQLSLTKQIKIIAYNFQYNNNKLQPTHGPELQFIQNHITTAKSCQLNENLARKKFKEITAHKCGQVGKSKSFHNIKTHKCSLLEQKNILRKSRKLFRKNPKNLKDNKSSQIDEFKCLSGGSKEYYEKGKNQLNSHKIKTCSPDGSFKLQQIFHNTFRKCGQLNKHRVVFRRIIETNQDLLDEENFKTMELYEKFEETICKKEYTDKANVRQTALPYERKENCGRRRFLLNFSLRCCPKQKKKIKLNKTAALDSSYLQQPNNSIKAGCINIFTQKRYQLKPLKDLIRFFIINIKLLSKLSDVSKNTYEQLVNSKGCRKRKYSTSWLEIWIGKVLFQVLNTSKQYDWHNLIFQLEHNIPPNSLITAKENYLCQFLTNRVALKPKIKSIHTKNIQHKYSCLNISRVVFQFLIAKCNQPNRFTKGQRRKLKFATITVYSSSKLLNKQPNILPRQTLLTLNPNKKVNLKLASNTNIVRHFQLSDVNNNFYQVEGKQQKYFKKFQQILYCIFLSYYCCCSCSLCHIYGFPLVLVKIFKYLKDATVHVLTRQLKITTTTTKATSIHYNYGHITTACEGKLKKPTKVADCKTNQQNLFKQQRHTITTNFRSSSCLTTSLTTSSATSYCKSLENFILQQKQQLQHTWMPHFQYQHNHYYHHHHHHQHYRCHHYQHKRQRKEAQKKKKQQRQKHEQQQQQQYNANRTIHLQLPSLLVFSRTLIILILLSSLWHTSEGFHSNSVKLSTNTVKTKYGLVRGIVVRSVPSLVEAYLGVPYASPPVGSLRFMPPITPSTWKNVRNADRFSPVCPQNVPIPPNGPEALLEVPRARLAQLRRLLPLLSNQSEDCLYLNIYVPYENRRHRRFTINSGESNDTPKLPTILFIHGESYEWNSGNPYDGSELAAHGNVIVVTINFRLGILGFLKTGGKESAQGNFGLMDLVAGLHWLKENLPAFGGDPQQITLLGHGTGAALANILVVSPVASDLIQHVVMVSGSALSPWAIQKNPLFVKRRVAEQTGCHGDMLYYDLAPCLRTKTVTELLAIKIDHPRFLAGFAPFVDGTVISPKTDSISKLTLPLGATIVSTSGIEYANFPKRNLIFCLTSVESHLDLNAQDLEFGFNETRRDRILRTYVRNNFHYHLNEIFAVLKNEYTDWDKAIRSPLSSRDATLQFLSDGHTASSLIKLGYMHSLRGGKGYFLHFKHRTLEEEYPQRTGSVRGEDVPFWLGLPISPLFPHNYTTQEKQISHFMLRYLANFAKTGNPNQSSLPSPLPSSSSLISSPASNLSSLSNQAANASHGKNKRSSLINIVNATSPLTSSGPIKNNAITAAASEALNLAVLYNQRRTKRTYYKRHSRSNDDHSGSASSEMNYFLSNNDNNNNNPIDSNELPFWDAYDVVNQLYLELGNKAEIQSHYRGHKLSMWLNLIPQLHRHANMNDQSMRHHQFQDDVNNLNLYEGIVRAQIQTKPDDDDENLLLPKGRQALPLPAQDTNTTQKPPGGTTECGVDGAMFVAEITTLPPNDNHSLILDSREKEMATASTGLIGNLEVLRRLSGKQFQSYTTALVATVAVGCFLLVLNILIFAGIYHQREKRARDAKTKEELQDNDTSKNSSMLKLNALGSETGSFNDSSAGVSGKTTVVFGEYSCYDEKSLQTKDEKLMVELPPAKMVDANWAACSTSTLDLLKTKHHTPVDTSYTLNNVVPLSTDPHTEHLIAANNLEIATYNPMASALIIDSSFATTSSSGLLSKRGSFVGSAGQLNQYDFASVQSSDQMSFKDIENAVKASATMNNDITQDDDIPEPPPPPRSFQNLQQQVGSNVSVSVSGSVGGGILRQAGTSSTSQTGGGKKRVHIQEISV